jgi:TolB-like protein/class 3 adenylate cyclase
VAQQRVERKLAAILAADVAGYGRLMEADEAGIARRVREHREAVTPIVTGHGGRIVKTTGDGVLLEFPSVVAAVECAVAIQALMTERNAGLGEDERMLFRIGINLGDVLIEGDDILGDGVNIAARLEGIAEPGGICISGSAFEQVQGKVDVRLSDQGEQSLKNITRPVRVYRVEEGLARVPRSAAAMPTTRSEPPRLSVVVLPFANIGGDTDQDYFMDGVTENLTTDLTRIPGAFVISRNTAFAYKGKTLDARRLGGELGVRYVMEGSVQCSHDRIRVNSQLIDTDTGAHLWAERFDQARADLFDMQDEITTRLARTVGIELVAAEGRRAERERPNNMDAVDLAMRGRAIMNQPRSLARAREARALFESALRFDDQNIDALVGLAGTLAYEVGNYVSDHPADQLRAAETAISAALAVEPNNADAHYVRAQLHFALRAPERALHDCERAISLDRNLARPYAYAGMMKLFVGRGDETKAYVAQAMRLSPRDPFLGTWYSFIGIADLFLGKLDQAVDHLRKSVEINPNHEIACFILAAALALAGREAEAAEACAAGLRLAPNFTIAKFRAEVRSNNPVYLAQRERVYEGMRKARVPEE